MVQMLTREIYGEKIIEVVVRAHERALAFAHVKMPTTSERWTEEGSRNLNEGPVGSAGKLHAHISSAKQF